MSNALTQSIAKILPEDQRANYSAFATELEPLVASASYLQAIARIDMILQSIPTDQSNRMLRAAFLAKRGEIYLEGDYNEEAEEDLRHAVHNGIKTPELFAMLGWTHYHMDQADKAREWFDRAVEGNGGDESALMGRALVLQELDELDAARDDLTLALKQATKRAELYAMRSEVYARQSDIEGAERDIKAARAADPQDTDYAIAHARIMTAMGKPRLALDTVEEALKRVEAPALEELLLRSHLRLINGEIEKARQDALTATKSFSDEAFAFVQLAQIQLSDGQIDEALKSARRAVELDDELPDAFLVRGAVRRLKGQHESSKRDLEKASQTQPELPIFLFGAAYGVMDTSDFHADLFAKLKEHDPAPEEAPVTEAPSGPGMGANPFGGFPGMGGGLPGMGGMDPMKMMSQMFDDEGNIRAAFKPIVRMALKNAPSILKNMPSGMLKNMGGVDKEMLENVDLSNMSADQLEAQMKQMYKMMKSGEDPQDMVKKAREEYDKNKK
jgi:tetratricopeptide (TPR) repeat protein